ncbi:MAG: hypothetical protein HYW49_07945 [Deltaproteobacteria bacterium]|nr:hypothetical protein [Deltaproteobacteria bacterium]
MKTLARLRFYFAPLAALLLFSASGAHARKETLQSAPTWRYDAGPDVNTPEGKRYAEIFASIPNFKEIGTQLFPKTGGKFRYAFGPTFYRGRLTKNSVKVLVIGQDGTHIAEAAGRTFTGGTGGRLQNVVDYLGINESYLFINTFAYTIKDQYADFAPVLVDDGHGGHKLAWKQLLSPEGFLLSQDLKSPIVQWRNTLIDHILATNKDSLKLIIAVGGAARDTLGTYIKSRGAGVPTIIAAENAKKVQMVAYGSAHAGGNKSFFYPLDEEGKNALLEPNEKPRYFDTKFQNTLMERAKDPKRLEKLLKPNSGPYGNGVYDLAQFGYDLEHVATDALGRDIRFIAIPHPGSAGGISDDEARFKQVAQLEKSFQIKLDKLKTFKEAGWNLPSDEGAKNKLFAGEKFKYGKKPIPVSDFPFGKSKIVIDHDSSARRDGANVIEIGGRDAGEYDDAILDETLNAKPIKDAADFDGNEVLWEPSRARREVFDQGPGEKWAKLMTEGLDLKKVYEEKPGKSLDTDGIEALYVKNHPKHGAVGTFRGTFADPGILILADPSDYDDFFTARALTGKNGQALQGYLSGLGVDDKYLVLKTLPFDMTGASDEEWKRTLDVTKEWRKNLISAVLAESRPQKIVTFGKWADLEIQGIDVKAIPVVSVQAEFMGAPRDIPRSHLPFGMQNWVGTSGSRVVRASGKFSGIQYKIIVPKWVTSAPARELSGEEKRFLIGSRQNLTIWKFKSDCANYLK